MPVSDSSIALQLFDLAVTGDLTGFDSALTALSDASPAELAILHPKSVRYYLIFSCFSLLWFRESFSFSFLCIQGDSIFHILCKQGQVAGAVGVLKRGVDVNIVNKVIYIG